ncbi:MAG: DoxX family membrane protein [Deltaproteobacteria bacterium]|nr:DoxX family membrane protein [Deltaproteobacteria bacterium]MBW1747869.1 DoxX family membrane protein [Deltaproteobacteria bacterium]MBW2155500.1 DoxX family membrane protein [Deltaproteobacteria bacterium]MBW2556280.1 DoxX family membrane protein [Deltaproteobacteria bacterium]
MMRSTMSEAGGTVAGRKDEGLLGLKNIFLSTPSYNLSRILLSVIFLWSGISKLMAPQFFAVIIENYGLLPDPLTMPAAIVLSIIEVLAGLGLLADIRGSLAVVTGLLASFMVILSYGVWLGLDIDCGCFGSEDLETGAFSGLRSTLFRDIVMMLVIFYLYFWRYRHSMAPKPLTNLFRSLKKKEA